MPNPGKAVVPEPPLRVQAIDTGRRGSRGCARRWVEPPCRGLPSVPALLRPRYWRAVAGNTGWLPVAGAVSPRVPGGHCAMHAHVEFDEQAPPATTPAEHCAFCPGEQVTEQPAQGPASGTAHACGGAAAVGGGLAWRPSMIPDTCVSEPS